MAREYAQIKLSIWDDDDWRELSAPARYLYMALLTSPSLTHCGSADWRPARLAALTGLTVEQVEGAGAEMVESLHLVIDEVTEEVLIRSYVRNDGLMKQPKMAVAMANARAGLSSTVLRGVVIHELKRLHEDYPDLKGWGAERARELLTKGSVNPSDYPLGKGSVKGSIKGKATPSGKGSPTPAPTPTPTPSSLTPRKNASSTAVDGDFDEWWMLYPRKVGKQAAAKAYAKAHKAVGPEVLLAGLQKQLPMLRSQEERFRPHPSTWLNEGRWDDEQDSLPVAPEPEPRPRVSLRQCDDNSDHGPHRWEDPRNNYHCQGTR